MPLSRASCAGLWRIGMRMSRRARTVLSDGRLWVGVAAALIAVDSPAHRMPGSLTTIKTNPASGNVEVIHRLHSHDAELGIITASGDRSLTLDRLEGRAHLALYVELRFKLANVRDGQIGAPLPLETIGAELDGEFVLVYQQLTSDLPRVMAVRNDILRDVFPEQVNLVNIAVAGEVHSLVFRDDDKWQITRLE